MHSILCVCLSLTLSSPCPPSWQSLFCLVLSVDHGSAMFLVWLTDSFIPGVSVQFFFSISVSLISFPLHFLIYPPCLESSSTLVMFFVRFWIGSFTPLVLVESLMRPVVPLHGRNLNLPGISGSWPLWFPLLSCEPVQVSQWVAPYGLGVSLLWFVHLLG